MIRILALNEESHSSGSEDEDAPTVTKEAQETIAVSEYVRALKLKTDNSRDDACNLFRELLETEVLHNVSIEKKDKLFSVKYNCYKNLGFIYNEMGDSETALSYLLNAYDLDDTDVFTMNKLGQLALQMNKIEIALITFEKCLVQNPNHWPSLDGVLKVLCLKENYSEAYGWALLCYSKDKSYDFALNVILEVRSKFESMGLEYIENCFKIKFTDLHLKRTTTTSVFPGYVEHKESEPVQPNFSEFKLSELTWLSTGQLIVDLYKAFEDNEWGKHTIMTLSDLISNDSITTHKISTPEAEPDVEKVSDEVVSETDGNQVSPSPAENLSEDDKENSNSNEGAKSLSAFDQQVILSADGSADDSDATKQSDANGKSKQSRRRGSDLKFLEQWGWHKTKKVPVQRRSNVEQNYAETSINGILKKILAKHFENNFDDEPIFQTENIDQSLRGSTETVPLGEQLEISSDDFQIATQSLFDEFMVDIEKEDFNIIILVLKWLKYVSIFWNQVIPKKLLDIYLKLYPCYLNHYDLCTWNLLDKEDFNAAFRMTLFYLELFHDKCMHHNGKTLNLSEVNAQWLCLYNHIIFQSGFFEVTSDEDNALFAESRIRILWLQYCFGKYENDLQRAVDCIYNIDELLQKESADYEITFSNQKQNRKIDSATCNELEKTFERTISLNSVNNLYHENSFNQLIDILKDTIISQATQTSVDYDSPVRLSTQIEVFLESLWNIESFEECLIWSEKFLKYALDNYLTAPNDTFRQTEWGDMVTYILTYIEALVNQESIEILLCLDKFYSRLIQSLSKIVVNQLDVPYDKNSSRTHPVSTKLPWIILYHILQREEDFLPAQKPVNDECDDEESDEMIPNSLMIFFTAHDFLGRHRLCTNHNGGLLLFTLDVVATRLRAPNLEHFREIIAEYLEQVTYCLYGYPSKKARSRHIGKHDAVNIELDWQRGMQLFDIYRPDNLPEFNSYKNDSISSEHEQLLQRIIVLIPVEVDPSGHTEGIHNFITGTVEETPQPFRLLPHRVHCIYYLLADYYFKNRDMLRSVKYYILDLTVCPTRFDSWAGLALSKASILEVKLNSCSSFCTKEFISESEEALRCFRQCFELKERHVLLWIEYGNFAYMMHSFYSRNLKLSSDTLSMERFAAMELKKDECLTAASNCFNTVEEFVHRTDTDADDDQDHDEKWLYHYMLGKIAEKRKDQPDIFLDHYNKSAKCLYENNASYPFRINHSNPPNLSIEALEVYYRITSSIVKYLEQHSVVKKVVGKLFLRVLKEVGSSPFAMNQAKIDNSSINALKRKLSIVSEEQSAKRRTIDAPAEEEADPKKLLSSESSPVPSVKPDDDIIVTDDTPQAQPAEVQPEIPAKSSAIPATDEQPIDNPQPAEVQPEIPAKSSAIPATDEQPIDNPQPAEVQPEIPAKSSAIPATDEQPIDNPQPAEVQPEIPAKSSAIPATDEQPIDNPIRRRSQESNVTTTTNATTTTTGSDSSSSSTSESSSSDTSSDSDSSDDEKNAERPLSESELEAIYRICIRNLEECVTRFPEHYKSIYRLANIYLNAPGKVKDLEKCSQLLIGTYVTGLSNHIQGLFTDRKANNFFSGIWRIPSSEIDRPGSFSAHMSRCTVLLMEILLRLSKHDILLDLALNLRNPNPENNKRYIKEDERKELFQQAISFSIQSFRNAIGTIRECPVDKRDDEKHLSLLIEIFRAHQKAIKYLHQKETMFASLLVEGYKVFVEGKLENVPDSVVVLDAAIKLCQCEIVLRKNNGKPGVEPVNESSFLNSLKMFPSLANLSSGNTITTAASTTLVTDEPITTPTTSAPTTVTSSICTPPLVTTFAVPSSAPSTSTLNFNSSSRPRGRPPGSKNSLSKSLDLNQSKMSPTAIAAMLGIYSNPAMPSSQFSNPAQVSALLDEFYKLQASISPTSLLSALDNVNVSTSMYALPPATFNSTASSKFPKMDVKSSKTSIPSSTSVASNQASTVISVGSGQLTITPSSYTSSKVSKTSLHCDGADFDVESVIPKSQLSTNKMFSDMPGISKPKSSMHASMGSNMTIPKDLPKSLTITPTPAGFSSAAYTGKSIGSNPPHVTLHPEPKKQKKSHKRSATVPYGGGISNFAAKSSKGMYDAMTEYQQLQLMNLNLNLMSRNMVSNPIHNPPTAFQQSSSKPKTQSSNRKEQKSVKTLPFPMGPKNMLPNTQLPTMSSNLSRNFQQAHFNDSAAMKFGTTPMTAHSPNKSPVLPPDIARQPSPAMHQVSSQKTLQQKLAEQRQKSLQQESKKKE